MRLIPEARPGNDRRNSLEPLKNKADLRKQLVDPFS